MGSLNRFTGIKIFTLILVANTHGSNPIGESTQLLNLITHLIHIFVVIITVVIMLSLFGLWWFIFHFERYSIEF